MEKSVSKEPFWALSAEESLSILKTDKNGLSNEEAGLRLKKFGKNLITEKKRLTKTRIILHQIKSPLIIILLIAGVATLFLGELIEAGVIFASVIINTFLGFYQENKAETAIELLKSYIKTRTRVKRESFEREIDAEELIPGDIIHITRGDRIPADARLIFSNNFEVDESIITGESLPIEKNIDKLPAATALADRKSMVFSGALAVEGLADAVVTATGNQTQFGMIAALTLEKEREKTPLERALSNFSNKIGIVLLIFVAFLFSLGLYFNYDIFEMFLISVSVAVSAVPEGLPIALTVILAVGVQRLAEKKGIVRKLLAAETLGSTTLILTDKTGTLTQAKMELAGIIPYGDDLPAQTGSSNKLLTYALLNTDAVLENPNEPYEKWRIFGRSIDAALIRGAAKEGLFLPDILKKSKIIDRLPFSSVYKYAAIAAEIENESGVILFGAPDILLNFTSLSKKEKENLLKEIENRARLGEKVLGVIFRKMPEKNHEVIIHPHTQEIIIPRAKLFSQGVGVHKHKFSDFEFLGILTFRDPLRPQVKEAMNKIAASGVRTVMVTGDHYGTAEAIARELGMVDGKGVILTGDDLNYLKKEELEARLKDISVYARVTPEQKLTLAKIYQEKGEIVAMTGDGVNDAPALGTANIGIALGSGSDVAKDVADLVILDDNFETIVAAIEEGRRILDNIRKVIVYLLSNALDELLLIGGSLIFGLPLPINALQILFVNLFSDSFPSLGLAFEKGVDKTGAKPRRIDRNLFDPLVRFLILIIGILTSAFLFFLYYWMTRSGFPEDLTRTFIFSSFATYTLFLSFSLRSLEKSIFKYNPFSNVYLVIGVGIGLILTLGAVYLPFFQNIFKTTPLPFSWLLAVFGIGFINILAVEFGKWIFRIRIK